MLEDELLKLRFLGGSSRALARIYRKYADRLLTLAMALLRDGSARSVYSILGPPGVGRARILASSPQAGRP